MNVFEVQQKIPRKTTHLNPSPEIAVNRRFGMNQPRPAALWVQAPAPGWPACQFGLSGFKPARFAAWCGIFWGSDCPDRSRNIRKLAGKPTGVVGCHFWMFALRACKKGTTTSLHLDSFILWS